MDDQTEKDGTLRDVIHEMRLKENAKIDDWKKSSRTYYKERGKTPSLETWDPNTGRLPNTEEISANRGWPSREGEEVLKKTFFSSFRQSVLERIGNQNEAKTDEVLGLLYGIYLINYVTGGLIINKHFDYPSFSKWDLCQWKEKTENLDPSNLDNWPIKFNLNSNRCSMDFDDLFGESIRINVGVAGYQGIEPHKSRPFEHGEKAVVDKSFFGLKSKKSFAPIYTYSISPVNEAVLTGIEEAHHALRRHLRHVQGLRIDYSSLIPNSTIEVFDTVRAKQSKNDLLDYYLTYHAARTTEFTAELAQSIYVKRYLPDTWKGYEEYLNAIKKKRVEIKSAT